MKKKLSITVCILLSILTIACNQTNNTAVEGNKDLNSLLENMINKQLVEYNLDLPSLYTVEHVIEQKKLSNEYIQKALDVWPFIEDPNSTVDFDYSNIVPLYEAANNYKNKKNYPLAIRRYELAEGYARRVITYYELEKEITTADIVYKESKENLEENKKRIEEIADIVIKLENHINKENFSNLLAVQERAFKELSAFGNYFSILEESKNDPISIHVVSGTKSFFEHELSYMEKIIKNIRAGNLDPDKEVIKQISENDWDKIVANKLSESEEDTVFNELIHWKLQQYEQAKEIGLDLYSMFIKYELESILSSLNNNLLSNEKQIIKLIEASTDEAYQQLLPVHDKFDTRWINDKLNEIQHNNILLFQKILDSDERSDTHQYLYEDLVLSLAEIEATEKLLKLGYSKGEFR